MKNTAWVLVVMSLVMVTSISNGSEMGSVNLGQQNAHSLSFSKATATVSDEGRSPVDQRILKILRMNGELPPVYSDWIYWEEKSRSGYSIWIPSNSAPDFLQDIFLFSDLDNYTTRVERYREAFVVALLQPALTMQMKDYLEAERNQFLDATSEVLGLPGDVRDIVEAIRGGMPYQIRPTDIQTTFDNWQRVTRNKQLKASLSKFGVALGGISFTAKIGSDAFEELFLHAIANAKTMERMEAIDHVLLNYEPSDPAIQDGYLLAKEDVCEYLDEDFGVLPAAINAFSSHGGDYVIGAVQLVAEISTKIKVLLPYLPSAVKIWVGRSCVYMLAYDLLTDIKREKEDYQVMCAEGTLAIDYLLNAISLYDPLPEPTDPSFPVYRATLLNVMQMRYGLAYNAKDTYDDILNVKSFSPLDWLRAILNTITGSWGNVATFREQVLKRSMSDNLQWSIEIEDFFDRQRYQHPRVISHQSTGSPDGDIVVYFSKAIDPTTITSANISVSGSQSGIHSWTHSFDFSENALRINPNSDFSNSEIVSVAISTGITDVAAQITNCENAVYPGSSLAQAYAFSFQVYDAPSFVVVPWAGPNGSISPHDPTPVEAGGSIDFEGFPLSGFEIDRWYVDGVVSQAGGPSFTLSNVNAYHSVGVTFKPINLLSITVLSPNSGEEFWRGSHMPITWSWKGAVGNNVRIELLRDGSLEYTIDSSSSNDGSELWKVPSNITLASSYRIRISSTTSTISDMSDGVFDIGSEKVVPPVIPISNIQQLQAIGSDASHPANGHYVLTGNIIAIGFQFQPIGSGSANLFEGVLDGNSFTIQGLTISKPSSEYVGLFSEIRQSGTVKNLKLADFFVEGLRYVGAFAGASRGQILNCTATNDDGLPYYGTSQVIGTGNGGHVGGIAGWNSGLIRSSQVVRTGNQVEVYSYGLRVGGIAGLNQPAYSSEAKIEFCFTNCYVGSYGSSAGWAGGIVGDNENGVIRECGSTGQIDGQLDEIGGIVGYSSGGLSSDCFFTGEVSGRYRVGGIVGSSSGTTIEKSYASCGISASALSKGGISGRNQGIISNSFWDVQQTGLNNVTYDGSGGVLNTHGETTSEMKKKATYTTKYGTDWDFQDVWAIEEGADYPRLRGIGAVLSQAGGLIASSQQSDGVHVSWDHVTYNLAGNVHNAVYKIYRSTDADSTAPKSPLSEWTTGNIFIDSTAIPEEPYFYWVLAAATTRGARASNFSGPVLGQRAFPPAPTPTDLYASDGLVQSTLISWDGHNANYYRVYRSTGPTRSRIPVSGWQQEFSFVDNAASSESTYYYWVNAAIDAAGSRESEFGAPELGHASQLDDTGPAITVFIDPDWPIETQDVTSHFTIADSGLIEKVILHWRNSGSYMHEWTDIGLAAFVSSYTLGSYEEDDSITFWVEALDVIGNRTESGLTTRVIAGESVSPPARPVGPSWLRPIVSADFATGSSASSLGNQLEYRFSWGDGTLSPWGLGLGAKSWLTDFTYFVKSQARSQADTTVVSSWSTAKPVIIDSRVPAVSISTGAGEHTVVTPYVRLVGLSDDPEPSSGIATTAISTGAVNGGDAYDWWFDISSLSPGVNQLVVTSTDNVGNEGNDTVDITFDISGRPLLTWTGEQGFEHDAVSPDTVYPTSTVEFRIRYTDGQVEDPAPGYPKLHLNDSVYVMSTTDTSSVYAGRTYGCSLEARHAGLRRQTLQQYWFEVQDLSGQSAFGAGASPVSGLFYDTVATDAEDELSQTLPMRFELSQNYPNPFNPETVIEFVMPRASHVRIVIYNLLGQTVAKIEDRYLPAGTHRISWNGTTDAGSTLPSGVYFYRIITNEFVESKKMLLLK